jgi:hypothetical protein
MPTTLAKPKVNAVLALQLQAGGKIVSENTYDIVLGSREWTSVDAKTAQGIQLFDPNGKAKATFAGLTLSEISSLDKLDPARPLVIGDVSALLQVPTGADKLKAFVEGGGRVLLLQAGDDLVKLFPQQVKSYRKTQGEIVTMQIPESPVFDGIDPLDTSWFQMGERALPYACSGTYETDRTQPGTATLALQCTIHPDLKKAEYFKEAGAPIVEIRLGKGTVLASEMMLSAKEKDPIAGRLLRNMLQSLSPRP